MPLKSLLIDHLRLALMSKIQRETDVSYIPVMLAIIALSVIMHIYNLAEDSHIDFASLYEQSFSLFLRKKSITLEGKHATSVEQYNCRNMITVSNTFSLKFRAVMHHITKNMDTMNDLYELKEIANVLNRDADKTIMTVSQRKRILLDKTRTIYCTVNEWMDKGNSGDGKDCSYSHLRVYRFSIELFSYRSSLADINEYVNNLTDTYTTHLENLRKDKLFVYTLNNANLCDEDGEETENTWQETPHETMKSFSNLFFDKKTEVLNKIDFFVNNKEWYRTNGVPYTLGIALYGEPGTGKTSFIKALATRLGRHIVSISLASIKTRKQLQDIYNTTKYVSTEKHPIGFDKKIIVFEDIDCIGDLIMRRSESSENEQETGSSEMRIIDELKTLAKQITDTSNNKQRPTAATCSPFKDDSLDKITLDDLLNLWDGIRENTGRIMIITTNHYNKLDPALVRPGRIDIALHLGNATRKTIGEMYTHYYGHSIPGDLLEQIPDKYHSPAQIINYYVANHDNPEGFFANLIQL